VNTPLPLPSDQDSMSYAADTNQITFNLASKNLNAVFNIYRTDVFLFFVELQGVRNMVNSLTIDPAMAAMSLDQVPDLFSFTFNSLKTLEGIYGRNSVEYKVAVYLLDEVLVQAINAFSTIYQQKMSVEIVFLGKSAGETLAQDQNAKQSIEKMISNRIQADIFNNNFPSIYLKKATDVESVCAQLRGSTSYEVFCPNPSDYSDSPLYHELDANTNISAQEATKDAATYQIVTWFSIILIISMLATICAFCYMDVGADSMIYRSTNIKHQHIS